MATKLQTVNPADVIRGRNSRGEFKPLDYEKKVEHLAERMHQDGQAVPCLGHTNSDGKIVIDDGFTRLDAALLIRDPGFTDSEGRHAQNKSFKLKVLVDSDVTDDKAAFLHSITGNLRNEVTDTEESYADSVLRDEFQYTNAAIARFRGYTNQNRTDKLEKLGTMPDYVRELVGSNKLAMSVAVDNLGDVDDERRRLIIQKATDDQGRVQGARVRELLRELADTPAGNEIETGGADGGEQTDEKPSRSKPASGKSPGRTLKNLKDFIASYQQSDDANATGTALLGTLGRWLSGELKTDKQLLAALDELK